MVWQGLMDLTVAIYKLVKKQTKEELYVLSRVAVSIPSNIAKDLIGLQTLNLFKLKPTD
jgi:four helix bundle protein